MVWFFARAGQQVRITTRFDRTTSEYIVEGEWPDGDRIFERYLDYAAFNDRIQRLQAELLESRWVQNGAPTVLPDGWRGPAARE